MKKNIVIMLASVMLLGGVSTAQAAEVSTAQAADTKFADLNSTLSSLRYTGQAINYYKSVGNYDAAKKLQASFDELAVDANAFASKKAVAAATVSKDFSDRTALLSSLRYTGQAYEYYRAIGDNAAATKAQASFEDLALALKAIK